ncbi:MAG: rRNA maturation RNase YbeY [Nitrospirae bacterium]|nr:rRNA maturation RNase YbeY [Nitrospirota bacterium]
MPVFVHSRVRRVLIREAVVCRVVQQLLASIGETASEISLEFVGDVRMRRLNLEYRKKDRTTDVLAFASREAGGPPSPLLGDVVISVPMASRQAFSLGHSLNEELARLLIHGLLHVVGYDHERSEAEAQRMRRKEQALLATLKPFPKLAVRT